MTPRSSWRPTLTVVLVLGALTAFAVLSVFPPRARGTDAPAEDFSAGRAFGHVEAVGQRVHPAGSAAAEEVRDYITGELTRLGLDPRTYRGVGATGELGDTFALASVDDVVVRIPGTGAAGYRTPGTLFLVAHYDSVQVSYGANDDGAGVATLLETLRALGTGPRLRNDVVAVFTDAEEACLCGAEAFVRDDPLAADGGVVLNVEARGTSGAAIMFETSTGNADLVARYAHVPHPVGTSMAVEVYRILPNDTDFTPFLDSGRFTGLNTAYIDGSAAYHSPQDRARAMNLRSLQHLGANTLALTRQLGDADLGALSAPGSHDATYFPVLGTLWHYPGWMVWPLAALAVLAVADLAVLARRRRIAGFRRSGTAFLATPALLVTTAVVAQAYWAALVTIRPGYRLMTDPWRPWWLRAGLLLLVAAVVLAWFPTLRRRVGRTAIGVAGLAWLAVLGVVMAAYVPGGSYLAALPALAGAVAWIAVIGVRQLVAEWDRESGRTGPGRTRTEGVEVFLHASAAALAIVVLAPTALLFLPALGLATGAAPALVAVLLVLATIPVLDRVVPHGRARLVPAAVALVAGVGCAGVGLVVDRFDEAHPQPTQLMYALDADAGQAWWVSEESRPGSWTAQYVTGHEDLSWRFPLLADGVSTGPATAAELPPPDIEVTSDRTSGGMRTIGLRVTPRREVRLVSLSVDESVVAGAQVQGREVPVGSGRFDVVFHAPPADGVELELTVVAGEPVTLRASDGSDGLADLPGFSPRPPDIGIEGTHTSELVLVGTAADLGDGTG